MHNLRDEDLFNSLLSYGFLSSEQVRKLHFPSTNKRTVLRRLRFLKKKRMLERFESSRGGTVLWSLSGSKARSMGSDFVMKNINRSALEHDLKVNELRLFFEQKNLGSSWKSSHYLRFKMSQEKSPQKRLPETIPDWIVTLNKKVCALELELNFKGKRRMDRVLTLYADKKSIQHLWYFVPSKEMREKILFLGKKFLKTRGNDWLKVSVFHNTPSGLEVLTASPTV